MNTIPPDPSAAALLQRLSGSSLDSARLLEVVAAYAPIFEEISRLHALDLHDVHPVVIYEPTAPYRTARRAPR